MKKSLLLFLLLPLISVVGAAQQPSAEVLRYIRENPRRAAFNTHSYEFHPVHDTKAPKGYKPFYISHYGRHGSRGAWGLDAYQRVQSVLTSAQAQGLLTPAGDSLLRETTLIIEGQTKMDGELTRRGTEEHALLARRMYRRFPEVFRKGTRKVRAASSIVPRCIVSMNAFTSSLTACQKDLQISWTTGERYMDYIGRAETTEIRERRRAILSSVEKPLEHDSLQVLRTLFTNPDAARSLVPSLVRFERDIFTTAKIAEPFDINDTLMRYLPFDFVMDRYMSSVMRAYLGQCNSLELGDLRMRESEDLVRVLVTEADEAIAGGPVAADLCFGHDWPYLGLVSYLGLEGVGDRLDAQTARTTWMGSKYCPLAANLQMIFYRNRSGDVLVKFLVNEQETPVRGLQPVEGPYYRWSDFKATLGIFKQ